MTTSNANEPVGVYMARCITIADGTPHIMSHTKICQADTNMPYEVPMDACRLLIRSKFTA